MCALGFFAPERSNSECTACPALKNTSALAVDTAEPNTKLVIFRKSGKWPGFPDTSLLLQGGLEVLADLRNVYLYQATIRKAAQVLFRGISLLEGKFVLC